MKNCQSRKRWAVPRLLQRYLQLTAQWLNGHLLHLCWGWSDEGHIHFPSCDWKMCPNTAVRYWSGRIEQSFPQPFSFTGSLHILCLKPETKICQGQASPCQEHRSWQDLRTCQGQSAIHVHWAWSNIWQTKICRIQLSGEHPTKNGPPLMFIWMSYGRWGVHSLPPPEWEKRCYKQKPPCLLFAEMGRRKWGEENQLSFWKGRKASTPMPTAAGLPGEGEGVICWLCSEWGCCVRKKTWFLFFFFPARSGRENIQKGLLPLNDIWLLHTSTLQFYFCTAYLHFMQGKLKWHLSVIPTKSRTPNTSSPKEVFIMLCQEMSDTR